MWKVTIPMLTILAVGAAVYGTPGGRGEWVAMAQPQSVRLEPRTRLDFGGEFIHPVYTEPPAPARRRMLM